ncbi:MAG: winged helix-turn-helix transcriptional regulator [Spirulinaceae cyanobacterium]
MAHSRYDCNLGCPIEAALEVMGGKWKGIILYHLLSETLRFNEIRRLIPEVTHRMLTKQLRELEAQDLISRTVYPGVPPKVEYAITEYGKTLSPVIYALQVWGLHHLEKTKGSATVNSKH